MVCSRCKKRMAVVFITRVEGEKTINEGLCLQCANELGIKPVNDMMQQMGISKDDLENAENEIMQMMSPEINEDDKGDDDFENGGTQAFPPFMKNMFGATAQQQEENTETKKNKGEKKRKFLNQYCINLTQKAKDGKIDRIIGRDKELYRVVQILNRRTKNNPCLIGEPGVGKTAIAEGLALKIYSQSVPAKLATKEVFLLDLTALVAGTQFRGQFESRIKGLVDEVKREGNIILFIDEVHNLVGTGDAEGSMNAANILKPALSRGEIQVIGATTFNEYRKFIEKDAALERRFQPVTVEEPSISSTVEILTGIKNYYETYHGVIIDDETVSRAVALSERYITDRYLPDKAIDLIDEAASSLNIEDTDANDIIKKQNELSTTKAQLDDVLVNEADNFEKIATCRANVASLEQEIEKLKKNKKVLHLAVDDLAKVIELWTGIPASRIKEDEYSKIISLEETLKSKIIGQDHAIEAVVRAIKRNRAGISSKKKPISFIFAGPTGVGKTELVKQLSQALFDSPETFIRLDMSEFMEKHSVSRIIGAPPGYVGYDDAGQLTEKIRRKPYSVILFDEIEKAHPDVLNILLQILDDGRVTDAHGKRVNFENTVIIMTTNAGSEKKEGQIGFSESSQVVLESKTMKALEAFLRPEFINRVDEIITFNHLNKENFNLIADIMLNELKEVMSQKGILLIWNDEVLKHLVEKSFSTKYGARNLRRTIEKEVEDSIATAIIDNYLKSVTQIVLEVKDDIITLRYGKLFKHLQV